MTTSAPPLFVRALGSDFDRLHPRLQERFSVGLAGGRACVGRGVMHRVWHGPRYLAPFLAVGALRNILVPETGENVFFTIENVPYRDAYGRETLTFVRTFAFPRRLRRFDATMVYSPRRGGIVDYLGTHQHLATDLHPRVDDSGALVIESGRHRLREGPVDVGVPDVLAGRALVRESYDDAAGCFRIGVEVSNPLVGPLFGYEGWFTCTYPEAAAYRPRARLRPVREEQRL
ncbi:DUF4166 domain-containing protein [Streptomonospora litoralis]|uniref:DUF4166 domain-containing protein n=1 Tax=Streptomonospora litoralis TaxID=2498135 RepID=A0A4P6Q604_9ACTN|nr:DUF4166 domain-containing protein [Streptomonospora litoralis]QBI54324.1 hypothetical protein EKD16_12710 [Streptomonospora litoralis]